MHPKPAMQYDNLQDPVMAGMCGRCADLVAWHAKRAQGVQLARAAALVYRDNVIRVPCIPLQCLHRGNDAILKRHPTHLCTGKMLHQIYCYPTQCQSGPSFIASFQVVSNSLAGQLALPLAVFVSHCDFSNLTAS